MITDTTMSVLQSSLTGLAERQRVNADNIANVQTPGFLAGRTDFETALRGSLATGTLPANNGGTVVRSMDPTRTDGNNVNLDAETLIATETGLRYELSLRALNDKYNSIRDALRTQ